MKAALINYPFELVAPMAAIGSILLLPLGPLLIPRFYLVFLLVYFTCFLYTQVNHLFKFYITANLMTKTIRNWNQAQRGDDKSTIDDETLEEMESALKPIDESSLVHAFIVPNYAEPEGLLRDTIKRLANHK